MFTLGPPRESERYVSWGPRLRLPYIRNIVSAYVFVNAFVNFSLYFNKKGKFRIFCFWGIVYEQAVAGVSIK
jgi:hypothetical protein